jgi:hypothetical protein
MVMGLARWRFPCARWGGVEVSGGTLFTLEDSIVNGWRLDSVFVCSYGAGERQEFLFTIFFL